MVLPSLPLQVGSFKSSFSKIQIGFTFLVPALPGSPGKRAVKRVCVCEGSGAEAQPKSNFLGINLTKFRAGIPV